MARNRIALIGAGQIGARKIAPIEICPAKVATGAIDGLLGEKRIAILRRGTGDSRAHDQGGGCDETQLVHDFRSNRSRCGYYKRGSEVQGRLGSIASNWYHCEIKCNLHIHSAVRLRRY